MSSLFGSKPKMPKYTAPTVLSSPTPKEVPQVVAPVEDETATQTARRKEMMRSQQRGGMASTALAEDRLG